VFGKFNLNHLKQVCVTQETGEPDRLLVYADHKARNLH